MAVNGACFEEGSGECERVLSCFVLFNRVFTVSKSWSLSSSVDDSEPDIESSSARIE